MRSASAQAESPPDPRLKHRPGLPAEIFVEPSREQWFWVRHLGRWFAPSADEERGAVRFFGRFFVVPSSNVTNFSLQYQSYLFDIFHQTKTARAAHFTCTPLITTMYLAALASLHVGRVSGLFAGTVFLAAWWLVLGLRERMALWGALSAGWAIVLGLGAKLFASTGHTPWLPLVVLALIQAVSHAPEPRLPPRTNGTARWLPTLSWLMGEGGDSRTWGARLLRLLRLSEYSIYGTIDEAMASPRLAPVNLLDVMWALGYAPEKRAQWKALSARAVASGNPAIDYIGLGGGTTLRWTGS